MGAWPALVLALAAVSTLAVGATTTDSPLTTPTNGYIPGMPRPDALDLISFD